MKDATATAAAQSEERPLRAVDGSALCSKSKGRKRKVSGVSLSAWSEERVELVLLDQEELPVTSDELLPLLGSRYVW